MEGECSRYMLSVLVQRHAEQRILTLCRCRTKHWWSKQRRSCLDGAHTTSLHGACSHTIVTSTAPLLSRSRALSNRVSVYCKRSTGETDALAVEVRCSGASSAMRLVRQWDVAPLHAATAHQRPHLCAAVPHLCDGACRCATPAAAVTQAHTRVAVAPPAPSFLLTLIAPSLHPHSLTYYPHPLPAPSGEVPSGQHLQPARRVR